MELWGRAAMPNRKAPKIIVRGAGCPACWGYSWPQPSRFITYTLNDLRCDPFSMTHVCMGCRLACKKMRLSKTIALAGCVSSFLEQTASAWSSQPKSSDHTPAHLRTFAHSLSCLFSCSRHTLMINQCFDSSVYRVHRVRMIFCR